MDDELITDFEQDDLDDFIQSLIDNKAKESPEILQKKVTYTDLLSLYLARFGKTLDDDYSDIVLDEFLIADNVDKKIQILQDALDKDIRLEESQYYYEIQEGYIEEEHFFK